MAKVSMKMRDLKRAKLAEKFYAQRVELKKLFQISMPLMKIVGMPC